MRDPQRIALLAAAAAVLILGFVLLGSSGSDKHAPPTRRDFTVTVAGGQPAGAIKPLAANKGDTISLTVTSNVADEIHIHGYDLHQRVRAGGSVNFTFKATIDGNFVIELESRAEQIAALTVKA